ADKSSRRVSVKADKINAVLGTDIPPQKIAELLCQVFIPTVLDDGVLISQIPSFRGDITCGEDIAEEAARMYGYSNIPVTQMTGNVTRGVISVEERFTDSIKELLCGLGFFECVTYSFGSMADIEKLKEPELRGAVKIVNPLGDDQAYMRTSPVPDMLKVVSNNINKKAANIRLFEAGRVYHKKNESLPDEKKYICISLCGNEDFFSLKGVAENIFEFLGIKNIKFVPQAALYYHTGRKASVFSGKIKLGELGEIAPDTAEAFGISNRRVYIAELALSSLIAASDDTKKYEPLPKYPAVTRDIALTVDNNISAGQLLKCITDNAGPYFESASLFDVYTGDKLGENKKSLAYSIVFRAKEKTLLDEEANAARDAIVEAAKTQLRAKLRD
ncbi:MAG: phenylalanine--tRNA ligase subunit beta, partial [Christensenellales bacterium]